MSLRLTQKERAQAKAYRAMLRRVRARTRQAGPKRPTFSRARQLSPEHKAAIAELFCVATAVRSGLEQGGVHVAHIRFSQAQAGARNPGLQRKPDDCWTLPLSPREHRLQHNMSEPAYWAELCIDAHALASGLWRLSPDQQAMLDHLRAEVARARRLITSGSPAALRA